MGNINNENQDTTSSNNKIFIHFLQSLIRGINDGEEEKNKDKENYMVLKRHCLETILTLFKKKYFLENSSLRLKIFKKSNLHKKLYEIIKKVIDFRFIETNINPDDGNDNSNPNNGKSYKNLTYKENQSLEIWKLCWNVLWYFDKYKILDISMVAEEYSKSNNNYVVEVFKDTIDSFRV